MMSLRALGNLGNGAGAAKAATHYYESESQDYYLKDAKEKEAGQWIGVGAKKMGLSGHVEKEIFQMALAGRVNGHEVQNMGDAKRQMGWDVTFSAPKSVSVVWALADQERRDQIEDSHRKAVEASFSYIEQNTTTRRGKGGHKVEEVFPIAAKFTHHTSRQGDPQLHTHVVIANYGLRQDGSVGTIESKVFYTHKMTAGALYQAELAYHMKQLGYSIEDGSAGTFRLSEVDKKLEKLFSKRTETIDKKVKDENIRTYAGTRTIVTSTRPKKERTQLEERIEAWKTEALEANLFLPIQEPKTNPIKQNIPVSDPFTLNDPAEIDLLVARSCDRITNSKSTFFKRDALRELCISSYGNHNVKNIHAMLDDSIKRKNAVLFLGWKNESIFSTPEMVNVENDMANLVRHMAEKDNYKADATKILTGSFLSSEQKIAVETATGSSGVCVVQGRAGTGKTTMLSAVFETYRKEGWVVNGLCISGQAALTLEQETGIPSKTIASWLFSKEAHLPTGGSQSAVRSTSAVCKTVLIVDEAGMVGSKQMKTILEKANQMGSKVILVGDEKQLQPIDAGGALGAIDNLLLRERPETSSQMNHIRRQRKEWMRNTVIAAANGQTKDVIQALNEHGKIHIYETPDEAQRTLVSKYVEKEAANQSNSLILTHRRSDTNEINALVRSELHKQGLVGKDKLEIDNGDRKIMLSEGDRIILLKNDYKLDVRNGQRGRVSNIDPAFEWLTIELDSGGEKRINLRQYNKIEYGWSSTTHKAQGATVDRCYVYGHVQESMASRQATYVQISRAREDTNVFAVKGARSIQFFHDGGKLAFDFGTVKKQELDLKETLHEMAKYWGVNVAKYTTLDPGIERKLSKGIEMSV